VAEAGGLVDKLSGVSVLKCNGFLERIGTLEGTVISVVETDAPHEQLACVVQDILSLRKPQWMISSGFAIAIHESVKRGDMVVANRVIDEHDYSLRIDMNMPTSKSIHVGVVLTRQSLPTQADKTKLVAKQALACETQAAVIAEVSRLKKTPMMAIQCVAQGLQQRPSAVISKIKSQDSLAGFVGAAAGALLDQPGSAKDLWHDKEDTLKLSDRLAQFLVGVVGQLPSAKPDDEA
jgi:nucleoside phosphorylase